jgi:alkylation response protein AidB-like acyl-CoA dehydrogenase
MDELNEIRSLAHEFATEQLRPNVERWDHQRVLDAGVLAQLGELGFFGMRIPEQYGGMAFGAPAYLAVLEELAWGEPAAALTVAMSDFVSELLLQHGSDAQKQSWLEQLASGAALGALAFAEENAGSDLAAVETRAIADGDQWRISGEKRWVVNGASAALALVLACTGEGEPGLFLVPADAAGWKILHRENTLGLRPLQLVTVGMDDVRVPRDGLLGTPGTALYAIAALRAIGCHAIAAIALGIARAAFEHARDYAAEREQFGARLRQFQGIQFKLADMAIRLAAARAIAQVAVTSAQDDVAAAAKVFASESAMWITTQAVQIFGGYGYMRDYPVEKTMRDAKATEILGETNEILRVRIAEAMYGTAGPNVSRNPC